VKGFKDSVGSDSKDEGQTAVESDTSAEKKSTAE